MSEKKYWVNGLLQLTTERSYTVEQILRKAGQEAGVRQEKIGDYILQHSMTKEQYRNLSDLVIINDKDAFLAIHHGATPYA